MSGQLAFSFFQNPADVLFPKPRPTISTPDYELVRSRRKSVSIEVHAQGNIVVRAPNRMAKRDIEAFILEKESWIEKKRAELAPIAARMPERTYEDGNLFMYLGEPVTLKIVRHTGRPSCFLDETDLQVLTHDDSPTAVRKILARWYLDCAKQTIPARVRKFEPLVGRKASSIHFRENKRRWGSCNAQTANLNFNSVLMMATLDLIDYVVVHELCHLIEANHSSRFWKEVERVLPDYQGRRDDLKDLEPELVL